MTAAAALARHSMKRVPVVDTDGALVGIVSRKDLLSVYLRADADLAEEIHTEVPLHAMYLAPSEVTVEVADGVVTLRGKVERTSMIEIIAALTSAVDGVVDVHTEITAEHDDTDLPPPTQENIGVFYPLATCWSEAGRHHGSDRP
ncbi:BON domain-containing protein [Nocardia vinacea]|uniref:BON domain-containing protein n=1 Tax=Nocardia vinacea TaxID=96468 RepID=UPI003410C355